jgi:hypothetical protein
MDYEREDRLATKRAYAAIESTRRQEAGEPPFTLLEAAHALGLNSPVSENDLQTLGAVCHTWNIRTNMDEEPGFRHYRQ